MELENGASFSLEALLENPGFRAWVLKGEKSAEKYWSAYQEDHPERREVIGQARQLLLDMQQQFETGNISGDAVEQRLQAQLARLGDPKKLGQSRVVKLPLRSNYRLMVAATILLLLIAGGSWWWTHQGTVYTTAYGEWETAELPDGSIVRLNSNTTLRLDNNWDEGTTRKVWLSGEAYFQIEKKPATQRRFQVITEDLIVEVLGTTFNVHSRGEHTEVFLEEGSVSLELESEVTREMLMEPGQQLAYSQAKNSILKNEPASAEFITSWKDGLLKYNETPIREVLQQVEDIYGIRFRVEDEAQYDRLINSQGIPIEKLEETVSILAQALGLTVQIEKNTYVLK